MKNFYVLNVGYEYIQPYLPNHRSRKVRYAVLKDTTRISIPIVEEEAFPVVICIKNMGTALHASSYMQSVWDSIGEIRGYNGKLYYPYVSYRKNCQSVPDDLPEVLSSYFKANVTYEDEEEVTQQPIGEKAILLEEADNRIKTQYKNKLHSTAKKHVCDMFETFLILNGKVWVQGAEPYVRVEYMYGPLKVIDVSFQLTYNKAGKANGNLFSHCYRLDQIGSIGQFESQFQATHRERLQAKHWNVSYWCENCADTHDLQKRIEEIIQLLPNAESYLRLVIDNHDVDDPRYVFDVCQAVSVFKLASEGAHTYHLFSNSRRRVCELSANNEDEAVGRFLKNHPKLTYEAIDAIKEIEILNKGE